MSLNNMSKEELIEELKKYMIPCKQTVIVKFRDDNGNISKATFTKGEYYRIDKNEGGAWIENNEEWFDMDNPEYSEVLSKGFK
jgi:hypothetical protein